MLLLLLLLHLVKPSAVFSRERNWECTGETRERLGSRNCVVVGSARERSFFLLFSLGGVSFAEEDEQDTVLIVTLARDI